MPLLSPSSPLSSEHRRLNRAAVIGLSAFGIVFGLFRAKEYAATRFAHLASQASTATVLYGSVFCAIGLLLLIYWRTRGFGAGLAAAGILSCAAFYGGMAVFTRLFA